MKKKKKKHDKQEVKQIFNLRQNGIYKHDILAIFSEKITFPLTSLATLAINLHESSISGYRRIVLHWDLNSCTSINPAGLCGLADMFFCCCWLIDFQKIRLDGRKDFPRQRKRRSVDKMGGGTLLFYFFHNIRAFIYFFMVFFYSVICLCVQGEQFNHYFPFPPL